MRCLVPGCLGAALFSSLAAVAAADPAPPPPATLLSDPTQLAAWLDANDANVSAAMSRLDAAEASRAQTGVLPNPELSIGYAGLVVGSGNPMNGSTSPGNTTNVTVGVSELIELGKRHPRQEAASARIDAAREDLVGALGTCVSAAITAMGKVAYLSARHDALIVDLAAQKKILGLEKIRVD